MQFFKKSFINIINNHLINYPTPINIHYGWNFGFLSSICLIVQIISGILLAMHYTAQVDLAFLSVEHICRNVNCGWLLRYVHSNGASFFFIAVYIHFFRGLYYGSFTSPKEFVWLIGIIILVLMIITAFLGYILPWGQMSLWGATVISKIFSVIPWVGDFFVTWLWGGFSVDNPTLNRFFSLHYFLPFIIIGASVIHIAILHQTGSSNPLGINSEINKISMWIFFILKDIIGLLVFFSFFSLFIYYFPNFLAHSDNYIQANPMTTPHLIVPEWYMLPFYTILRSIPWKLGGICAMIFSILILGILPWMLNVQIRTSYFRPIYQFFFWFFLCCCSILGWIGSCSVDSPYVLIGQLATVYYFSYFLLIIPILGNFENFLVKYNIF
uniref:apocytochrome b n=1 Tax=Neorhodella cyanea TaxID=131155 RepID=UPI001FCD2EA5|nr:apocytochrome b [Neorhodella cyanea]UNJ18811.1 apocytochrome b [Neorhodella cyanea]